MAQSWLHVINKKFLHPASTTENSNLIDFGWISGKLSDNTNDCCSKDHGIVYIYILIHNLIYTSITTFFIVPFNQYLLLQDNR